MADLPILFSAPMVRAILREIEQPGTGKTQTRRILTPQPYGDVIQYGWSRTDGATWTDQNFASHRLRMWAGDRLYVRETWCSDTRNDSVKPSEIEKTEPIWFAADGGGISLTDWSIRSGKNRPGMFMPRWASRLTLTVTDVHVERLQDISREDAIAEGLIRMPLAPTIAVEMGCDWGYESDGRHGSPVSAYASLWDSINGNRPGCAWSDNPWVAAYTFRPIFGNIDQIGGAL